MYTRKRKLLSSGHFEGKARRFVAVLALPASPKALQVNCADIYPLPISDQARTRCSLMAFHMD